MSADEPVLALEDVEVEYRNEPLTNKVLPDPIIRALKLEEAPIPAVEGVSLEIGENDTIALVGESGSGKTTLGKTAVGLEKPTVGTVRYRGHDIWTVREGRHDGEIMYDDIRRALQIIHQDPGAALNPYRSVLSTLEQPLHRWFPELDAADRRERILQLLDEAGLSPPREYIDRYPHELSGGEQQRVVLLRAMICEPDLILADEPISALDSSLRVEIMDLMLRLQDMFETSYLFVSHNLANARYIASQADGRIGIMYLGELVEFGPVDEVIGNPQHPYTKVLKWATLPTHPDSASRALEEEIPLRAIDIPDVVDKPSGCKFHSRCPYARETCASAEPELRETGDGRRTACFREHPEHQYWDESQTDAERELGGVLGDD